MGIEVFRKHLREKRAIKVVSDIDNYNLENVAKICRAAQKAKASAVDVACSKEVFLTAKKNTKLPIFVSSIHPFELLKAVQWGADAIEIGGFSSLYKNGKSFSMEEAYNIVLETLSLINKYEVYTCATIPGNIDIKDQIELTKRFEVLGIDLVQTESIKEVSNGKNSTQLINSIEAGIKYTSELFENTAMPIMTNTGLDSKFTASAFSAGANAVSIDIPTNNLTTEVEMCAKIMSIVSSVSYRNSINKEIRLAKQELASI